MDEVSQMDQKELQRMWKKYRITARKYQGDDCYSWAVFIGGRPMLTGLGKSEVQYFKKEALRREMGVK